jgi:hypothetical protein
LLATISLLAACEYDPGGYNFVELNPPEDYISISISLNDVDPSDTIYLYQNTSFSINTNSQKDLLQALVLLDGQEYKRSYSNSLSFVMSPDQLSEGVHKLTVNAIFSSGTGSLAEMMGLEGYLGELSWNIRVIKNPQSRFVVDYRINDEGFLEIFWKNAVPESLIEKYTVHAGLTQNSDIIINDASQKSFTDSGYVCGNAYYEIKTCLKDGLTFLQRLSFDKPAPVISFEDLGLDNLRIFWDHPFANGRFILREGNTIIASGILDTTIIIPQIFGQIRRFDLETRPQNAGYDNFHNKFSAYGSFCLGTSLGLPNWPLYAYNITDNIIYSSKYDNLVAFNAATLQVKNTVSIVGNPWGLSYGGKIAAAPHNSTVAAMTGEETWIFTDSRFINPVKIPSLPGNIHTRLSALTSDDRFFVVQGGTNICKVFNSLTGEKIFEIPFTYNTIYDIPDFVTVSDDGKFFCAPSENGIEVFEITATATNLLYTDTRQYKGAMFVPSKPDHLLLRVGSDIELRQMPGFSLIQSLDVSTYGGRLCNIDPASMNLLYHQNDSLKVCKIDNLSKTLFKIRSNGKSTRMFNNKLFTYGASGITFDITPYLSH